MKNKFTKAMTSILLSSTVIIPMSSSILAEEPIQTATQSADTFMNTYLSRKVIQNGAVTYEPIRSVDDTNYAQIMQSESVYASMPDSLKAEINNRVLANTGMDYTSLLTASKERQKTLEQAAQPVTEQQPAVNSGSTEQPPVDTNTTTTQSATEQQAQPSAQPVTEQQPAVNSDSTEQPPVDTNTTAQSATEQQAQPSTQQPTTDGTQANSSANTTITRTATTAIGANVTAVYAGDTFSEDVNLTVSDVSKSDHSYSIDISFKKADGTELEPNAGKAVTIQITYPSLQGTEFEVVHTNDNQTSASINVSNVNANSAAFTANTFSVFTVQSKTASASAQATDKHAEQVQQSEKTSQTQTSEKVEQSQEKEKASAVGKEKMDTTGQKTAVSANEEIMTGTEKQVTTPAYMISPTIVKADTEQEDSISVQANAFITTYLTSPAGVIYESANASNYQYILNSGSAWNQLSVDVRRKVNQILTGKIGKTYLKLLTEAKNVAGETPRTGIETKAVSYSVMLGTSVLGVISATRKKKEQQ